MTEAEYAVLVAEFQTATLPKGAWRHSTHLAIAVWYIEEHGCDRAVDFLRDGIRALNDRHGVANTNTSGYHETLTRFWVYTVADHLDSLAPEMPRHERARSVMDRFGEQRDLFRSNYTFDVVRSEQARRE